MNVSVILSRPRKSVTIKRLGVFGLGTGFDTRCLQFLISVYSLAQSRAQQFTSHTLSPLGRPTPVLWYRLPELSHPTATVTLDSVLSQSSGTASSCPDLYCLELSPITVSTKVVVEVKLRLMVSWPVYLGLEPMTRFFYVWQLRVFRC
jgi:hypothetical protein